MSNLEINEIIDKITKRYKNTYSYMGFESQDGSQECWLGIYECCKKNNQQLEDLCEKTIISICTNRLNKYKDTFLSKNMKIKNELVDEDVCTQLNLQKYDYFLDDPDYILAKQYIPDLFKEHSRERKYVCYKLVQAGLILYDSLKPIDQEEFLKPTTDEEAELIELMGWKNPRHIKGSSTTNSHWTEIKKRAKEIIIEYIKYLNSN